MASSKTQLRRTDEVEPTAEGLYYEAETTKLEELETEVGKASDAKGPGILLVSKEKKRTRGKALHSTLARSYPFVQ